MEHIVESVVDTPVSSGGDAKERAKQEIRETVGFADEPLFQATTVFPFTLFRATVTLDRTQLNVTRRDIFKSGELFSIRIEDLLDLTADVNLFFGTVKIATRFFDPAKPYIIKFLKRDDALRLKRITQGYLVARQQEIDCNALGTKELAKLLDELGQVNTEAKV
jgi:hypothetical protein